MIKRLTPFKWYALNNFPFIEDTIDAIDEYQVLCNIVKYLNENIEKTNELGIKVEELNNWFENLDVQDEINNKLNQMVETGELQELLSAQYDSLRTEVNETIETFENNVNNQIENFEDETTEDLTAFKNNVNSNIDTINNKVNAVTNGAPYAVSSTSEMEDTSKIYVNTSDGKWYFYDGSNWTIGGTYQSAGIADGEIDILELSPEIQANFALNFSEDLAKGTGFQGFCHGGVGTEIQIETGSASYKYSIINLTAGKIYEFNGFNSYSLNGLVITDSNNIVVFRAPGAGQADNTTSCLYKANANGLKAYISEHINDVSTGSNEYYKYSTANRLRILNSIDNNLKISNTVQKVDTVEGVGLNGTIEVGNLVKCKNQSSDYSVEVYSVEAGKSYKIKGMQHYLLSGLVITDNDYKVIYNSYTGQSEKVPVTYEFTAQTNGFIFITKISSDSADLYSVEETHPALDIDINYYVKLKNKSIAYDGDSITESRTSGTNANGGAYPKIIADLTESEYTNRASGGATLSYKSGATGRSIARSLSNLPSNADMYVFSGGVNDMWDNRPLGTLSNDYTSEVDDTTIIGALEKIFRYSLTNFLGKPILFVITPKLANPFWTGTQNYDQFDLHDALVSVCKRYSIPYYDAFNDSGLNGWNEAQRTEFLNANQQGTPDGTHPNENAYKKYFVPQIIDLMNKNLF